MLFFLSKGIVEKNITLHKKTPTALYTTSLQDKNKHHSAKQPHWKVTYQQDPWKAWRLEAYEDTNTREKNLRLPFLFTDQMEKLFLNQAITTQIL